MKSKNVGPYALFLEKRNRKGDPVFGGYLWSIRLVHLSRHKSNILALGNDETNALRFNNAEANAAILLFNKLLPAKQQLRKTMLQ